ncbi:MAG: rod shape-determining protein [Nitrospirae bacterium]|nr:rod shape-determining protein [Nitrospirota bacterium]
MSDRHVLNVGIDLGTSRSVIACDNGIRTFVSSYVGFPKDAISKKLLGKDIAFGDDALRNKMAVTLYRPFDKGMLKYTDELTEKDAGYQKSIDAAKELLRHLIEIAKEGSTDIEGDFIVRGVLGAPAMASRKNKKVLLEIASGILDDVMIVSEPFAVAYGLNLLNNVLIVDIGAGTVDLCRMHGTMPSDEDQITTTKAGDYVDSVFYDLIMKKHGDANFTVNMVKRFKEENANISEHGDSIFIEIPVKGKPERHDVTNELKMACREVVPEIVEGIKKLIATFDPEFQGILKENVYLAGGGSQIAGLKKEIEDYMKKNLGYGKVTRIEETLFAGANGALMLCKDMPEEYWNEIGSKKK